jgi:hypothetical protein
VAETNRINAERFARIEAILLEHSRILRALPDMICDKLGFKSPETRPGQERLRIRRTRKSHTA